jgi:lipopolysaccharide transport protein LptA
MNKLLALLIVLSSNAAYVRAQETASPTTQKSATPAPAKQGKSAMPKAMGLDAANLNAPITTEIFADEAFFDSNKNVGIFTGRVKVSDPRFNLQSDKLTVFISKGGNQGLEKAIAEGNVAVVRDRPDPNGGPPSHAVGRSDTATYFAATGDVELKGTPRVQQGVNTHIGTSPETVMIINQNGQLTTHGPSRTDIKQTPKEMSGESKDDTKPEASPKP